jgi:hypothetical protein
MAGFFSFIRLPGLEFVQGYYYFWKIVFDGQQVSIFSFYGLLFIKLVADLRIQPLANFFSQKINFLIA